MKKIFICAAFFYTALCFSQGNFRINNYQVIWENVYEKPDRSEAEILASIQSEILAYNPINVTLTDHAISFKIDDDKINLNKLGRKAMSTPMQCSRNFDYTVLIDVKDNKYKVTIMNLAIDDKASNGMLSGTFEDQMTKKAGTQFRTGSGVVDALNLFSQYLKEKYSFTGNYTDNSKW
ncbi:MAG: hypothetical protein EOO51_12735 [Flavobacterium sp.]|nr:MAG: hypothetical protein EOO51_12735 [Flavobacterium sp.]